MEGEVFAKDVTDHRAEHMSSNGTNGSKGISGVNGINGINSLHGWHEGISKPWETVHFDPLLKPKSYSIKGTSPDSKILFLDVNVLDSTGAQPFRGDVLIEGERIRHVGSVPNIDQLRSNHKVRVIQGRGRTLMSGLGDAHTHLSWSSGDIAALGGLGVEEHTLLTARSAQIAIDSGYTMCFGAASAQERLDVVIRDAINDGKLNGPRYLANCKEITRRQEDVGQNGLAAFADGPDEMREVVRKHIGFGVDQVKLTMSGEEICQPKSSEVCYYTDEETAACVEEAHNRGVRLCAHARARDSVKMCVKHGVDIIFHASWADSEGMDMLEKHKSKHMVVPAINWLYATLYESEAFGYTMAEAERVGYEKEFESAKKVLTEMHKRGITVLPGGDYGFAWTPHGTYARDLDHFVKWLGFTPMESILAATAGVAKLFMREDELGQILPGYFADCILVDGNPLEDISILQDHSKLNVIIINGRMHKASHKDFLPIKRETLKAYQMEPLPTFSQASRLISEKFTNYVAYEDVRGQARMGHLDLNKKIILPLSMPSGAPLSSLYQIIELDTDPVPGGDLVDLHSVTLLPPISGRDILAVGKNYVEHAKEFNASGYDSSDKVDQPSQPVIFTKRSTSIIASEEDIYPHAGFTQTLDYEGEVGVIIGKAGFRISEKDAMDYVWGYTIINDVTARERQKAHKQFYLGKSADTFCPMGPIAVPAGSLPKELRVQTFVNGVKKQDGSTEDLIFSIAHLIQTISAGATIQPGDVIATGTPAGVGFAQNPPYFLKSGDVVEVSVTGLGTLRNRVAELSARNQITERVSEVSVLPIYNMSRTPGGAGLTKIGSKLIHVEVTGSGSDNVVFVHGLGGTTEFTYPLLLTARLNDSHRCYRYDLEGHGLSPTKSSSVVSIESYAEDLTALFAHEEYDIRSAVLVAHSMGCLIALAFASRHPSLVKKLVLLGPPRFPVPAAAAEAQNKRAAAVRASGMKACADTVATAGTAERTKVENPAAVSAVRESLMSQHPEGYAKACAALGGASNLEVDFSKLIMPILIVTGDEDKVSPVTACEKLSGMLKDATLKVLKGVGHWSVFEDAAGVGEALRRFL